MATQAPPEAVRTNSAWADRSIVIGLGAALAFLGLWVSWSQFPGVWTNDRNNGWVIAALTLWLLWRDRVTFGAAGAAQPAAVVLVGLFSLAWLGAVVMSIDVVHLALVPTILLAWLYAVNGRIAAGKALQVAALFALALPVWEVLIPLLQGMTVLVNTALIAVVRLPAKVEGSLILLEAGTLHVANSCAGFNYLMSGLTLGAAYAFLFTKRWQSRLKIVLVAGSVAIVGNWFRVFGLVLVGHFTKMQSSLMEDHVAYGWIIFAASMPLFFKIASRIERQESTIDVAQAPDDNRSATGGIRTVILATGAALIGPLLFMGLSAAQPDVSPSKQPSGIAQVAELSAAVAEETVWKPAFAQYVHHQVFTGDVDSSTIQIDNFTYRVADRSGEMIGGGNRLAADSLIVREAMLGPLDEQLRMVRESVVRTGRTEGRLAWYWYEVGSSDTPSSARARLLQLWAFLTRNPQAGITVVSAACEDGNCTRAREALFRVVTGKAMPVSRSP